MIWVGLGFLTVVVMIWVGLGLRWWTVGDLRGGREDTEVGMEKEKRKRNWP